MVEASFEGHSAFGKRSVQLTIVAAISCGLLGVQYSRWGAQPPIRRQVLKANPTEVDASGSRKLDSRRHEQRSVWLMEVDLNSADVMELALLPGIGPVLADRIVEDRHERGRFESVDNLLRVRGIGPSKLAEIRRMGVINP